MGWILAGVFLWPANQGESLQPDHPPPPAVLLPVREGHPRCVFREGGRPGLGRTFEEVRALYRQDPTFQSIMDKALRVDPAAQHPAANAACWIVSGEDRFAEAAIETMLEVEIARIGEPYYSPVWSYALAYDWLFHHPRFTPSRKERIAERIRHRIATELEQLDQTGMALWHGRNQASNGVMIAALVMVGDTGMENLLRRATAHWLEGLKALQFSDGWPEGASYWIYNRAGPYALAADCVLTATGLEVVDGVSLREVLRTAGLWQLYQFGPNEVFEPYGDSAGSLRLGETGWWTLTTDYFAKVSREPAVAAAGDFFRNRSPDPYGRRPYSWYVALSYDPTARPSDPDYDPARPELWMRRHLPQAMLFGRNSYGVAFFRGDWGDPAETFASFKAGDLLAHHDHYDTGTFTLQKGGNLAPQTGYYGSYFQEHRLGYQVQTVSSNSLLILAPGEYSPRLRRTPGRWSWLSGGQRVISPTGFHCLSLAHYRRQLQEGPHLERASISAWESVSGLYDYVAADITSAYNSTRFAEAGNPAKVSLVTRQFLYLRPEQVFLLYDRVETTDPRYLPKFLLHSLTRPESDQEEVITGAADNGILSSRSRRFWQEHESGLLTLEILLPRRTRTLKIGGPDFSFYVEWDGDQENGFNGKHLTEGVGERGGQDRPDQWRLEVEPLEVNLTTRFLHLLIPRLKSFSPSPPQGRLLESDPSVYAAGIGSWTVVVSHAPRPPPALSPSRGPCRKPAVAGCGTWEGILDRGKFPPGQFRGGSEGPHFRRAPYRGSPS